MYYDKFDMYIQDKITIFKVEIEVHKFIYLLGFTKKQNRDKIECSNIFKDLRSPVYGFPPASIGPCLAPVQLLDLCLVCGLLDRV